MPSTVLATGLRRFGTSFITRMLRHDVEAIEAKKQPERKKAIQNAIAKVRYNTKKRFEDKFPTKAQRTADKKKRKQFKKDLKITKKIEKESYKTDPLYRATTVPRQQLSDTTITWASQNPILPGFRRGLRKEFKYGYNPISKRASWVILKKISNFRESGQNLHKHFTPKGRKWLRKRKQEDATAKSILSGDV